MILLLSAHAVAALLAVPLVRRLGARGPWAVAATALAPAAVAAWALAVLLEGGARAQRSASLPWVPDLGLGLSLRLDPLSAVMVLVVTVVGAGVLVYSSGYFAPAHGGHEQGGHGSGPAAADAVAVADRERTRTVALLVAFAAAMLLLVLADDLLLLYVGWEITTVLSWLLVGGEGRRALERRRATQALVVTAAGGLAMLVGFVVLWHLGGTTSISALLADPPPPSPLLVLAAVCVLAGAATKCALVPFTAWLPGAMVAPTPVSAYLHAAAMVKAGVYLVARFSPLFADVPTWRVLAVTLGCATMLVGGWRSLRQVDLKLVLAHGTVSQLGFMVALFGAGGRTATLAGTGTLIAHALFKSTLFLVAGAVDHGAGTRDLRRLGGLARRAPLLLAASVAAAASMAGIPPLLGFVTKEAALEAFTAGLVEGEAAGADAVVAVVIVVGSMLTVAYSVRFVRGAFGPARPDAAGEPSDGDEGDAGDAGEGHGWHAPPATVLVPPLLGAAACLALGVVPAPVGAMADAVAASAAPRAALSAAVAAPEDYHLALWHGLGLPLAASALVVLGGLVIAAAAEPVARAATALAARRALAAVAPGALYERGLHLLFATAAVTTRTAQRGSLPQYLVVAFAAVVAGPGAALVVALTGGWPSAWRLADDPLQVLAALLVVATALAAVRSGHRRTAVLLVGGSGYALAALFALGGAPDLALTQVLVESLTLVAFVLVLRVLPARFGDGPGGVDAARGAVRSPRARRARAVRAAVAVAAGGFFALLSSAALAAREAPSVSRAFPALAQAGGGKNVVNVTLVDIRAWDTLGEVSVLVAAATGVASLVFLTSRTGTAPRLADGDEGVDGGDLARATDGAARQDLAPAPVAGPRSASGAPPGRGWLTAVDALAPAHRSVVVELVVRLVFPTVLVLSVWVLLSGHSAPGGGFAGGLVAGLALALRYVAGGRYELGEALPASPGLLLGSGLGLAAASVAAPLALGGTVGQAWVHELHVPVLGEVELVTSVFFDVGVYLIVVGLVADVLRSLGAHTDAVDAARATAEGADDAPRPRQGVGATP